MSDYSFVYVNNDGSVRELKITEKIYLQTKYSGGDGDKPYIKNKYSDKNGWGEISGFCYRKKIPKEIIIKTITENSSPDEINYAIDRAKQMGYEIDYTGLEDIKNNA